MSSRALAEKMPVDLSEGTTVVFSNGKQQANVSLPASKAAFALLGESWPSPIAVNELFSLAFERSASFLGAASVADAQRGLMSDLFNAVTYGMVDLHTQAPPCTNQRSDTPRASALAALHAQSGTTVVNAHHQMIELDRLGAQVLQLANGDRTTYDILEVLMTRVASGEIVLEENGNPVTAPDAARAMVARRLDKTLASLARSAVLVS
jgi:methyltransferase-like protein